MKSQPATSLQVVGAVAFYMSVSISLVFANKFVLTGNKLDAPLFLTWTQLVVAVACCALIASLKPYTTLLDFFPRCVPLRRCLQPRVAPRATDARARPSLRHCGPAAADCCGALDRPDTALSTIWRARAPCCRSR